jgi:hypothetical protein
MDRRSFLKLTGVGVAGLLIPKQIIDAPPPIIDPFDYLADGVGRTSALIMDSMHVDCRCGYPSPSQAYEDYATIIGKDQLTPEEKQTAFMHHVIEHLEHE